MSGSSTFDHLVVIELYIHDTIRLDRLDHHALEIDWQSPLQLVRAHRQQFDALAEGDVGVMVLVDDGEAVVSMRERTC